MKNIFKTGFPLEEPNIVLKWNEPLNEIAQKSGGVWFKDRFIWKKKKYLNGLNYLLYSENGITKNTPFKSITACIGINSNGLWDEDLSVIEFKKTEKHLIKLFGKPKIIEKINVNGERSITWDFNNINIYLSLIEQHILKGYLTISLKN